MTARRPAPRVPGPASPEAPAPAGSASPPPPSRSAPAGQAADPPPKAHPWQAEQGPDHRVAFELAPVGLVLSRHRLIVDCNREMSAMFGCRREQLVGQSFEVLYPTPQEFQRTGQRISAQLDREGRYADDRVMRRLAAGEGRSELFWCHVSGRALDPSDPHAAGIWAFEDLSAKRALRLELTPREREIAALLVEGLTSKLVGKRLSISPRTVDVYRARLMRKTGAATAGELVGRLLAGG